MNDPQRRGFLRISGISPAAAALGSQVLAEQQHSPAGVPTRPLGKTGEKVSIVGLGGYPIDTARHQEAISIMHKAIDQGLSFFDNASDCHDAAADALADYRA